MAKKKQQTVKYKGIDFPGTKEELKAALDFLKDSGIKPSEINIMRILGNQNMDYRKGGMVLSTVDNRKKT
jgi:hypothetical protein